MIVTEEKCTGQYGGASHVLRFERIDFPCRYVIAYQLKGDHVWRMNGHVNAHCFLLRRGTDATFQRRMLLDAADAWIRKSMQHLC